jgi:hypothetical protein
MSDLPNKKIYQINNSLLTTSSYTIAQQKIQYLLGKQNISTVNLWYKLQTIEGGRRKYVYFTALCFITQSCFTVNGIPFSILKYTFIFYFFT